MKKLLGILSFVLITVGTFAQDSNKKDNTTQDGSAKGEKKDCLMMKKGQMMVRKDGKKTKMTQNMTLPNGTKVSTAGKITMPDGTTKMLKEGEKIFMDGMMGKKKAKKQ